MAKKDIWMPLNIGDYLADTMSLTAEQHGVYILLLMDYWKSGPLADDDRQLAVTGKVSLKAWKAEIGPIIRRFFFKAADGHLHQKRADIEIAKTGRISEARRNAALDRHGRPSKPDANDMQTGCKPDANASQENHKTEDIARVHALAPPSPSERKKEGSLRSPLSAQGLSLEAEHVQFWTLYPRKKEGPAACLPEFKGARKRADFETIMDGLRRYAFNPEFLPMAKTWLHQSRWLTQADTQPETVEARPSSRSGNTATDMALDLGLDLATPLEQQFHGKEQANGRKAASSNGHALGYETGPPDGWWEDSADEATDRPVRHDAGR